MLPATESSSTSTAAGGPGRARRNCSVRQSRSTARKRKQPDGLPPRAPLLTKRETRSTSGPPMPRRGSPKPAAKTGGARSTATNPCTTSDAPTPSITAARLRTPTLRRIHGRTDDLAARHETAVNKNTKRRGTKEEEDYGHRG